MTSCNTSNNPLDPVGFNYQRDVNLALDSNCEDGAISCGDLINLCLCNVPEISPPPSLESAKCVNDIVTRPWPPPPPANPGCNPVSINITNRQDTSITPSENIRLEGTIDYVGDDPCLPELNLELITNPDFRSGGGTPSSRGWAIGSGGLGANSLNYYRILPTTECPNEGVRFNNLEDFMSRESGAEYFIPRGSDFNCNEPLNICEYRRIWSNKMSRWGLIGPRLGVILKSTAIDYLQVPVTRPNQGTQTVNVYFRWRYEVGFLDHIGLGQPEPGNNGFRGGTAEPGYACGPSVGFDEVFNNNYIRGITYTNELQQQTDIYAWNIKEKYEWLAGYEPGFPALGWNMTPGVNLQTAAQAGLKPQPIQFGTRVLLYGNLPWRGGTAPYRKDHPCTCGLPPSQWNPQHQCDCQITWFFDVPNALAGDCELEDPTPGVQASTLIPTRDVKSAGMFFGGIDVNRI